MIERGSQASGMGAAVDHQRHRPKASQLLRAHGIEPEAFGVISNARPRIHEANVAPPQRSSDLTGVERDARAEHRPRNERGDDEI